MKELKQKIIEVFRMWEVIYSKRKQLNVSVIRLWRLKRMKDSLKDYLPLFDLPDPKKYITKKIARDILFVHSSFEAILSYSDELER